MSIPNSEIPTIEEIATLVAEEIDADVIHYNGLIDRPIDKALIDNCISRRKRTNALVILVTFGGDPNVAYRIARCLQNNYTRFSLYVSGCCKSAGTLVALGAHELVVSDHGELGPLDVQLSKKDEIWATQSGLTVMDTLTALRDNAFQAFEKIFLDIQLKSQSSITARTAANIATEMSTGLFSQLYGQVDPLHIGEAARAMSIALHYGARLLENGRNVNSENLGTLISEYPSHEFVIDRHEVEKLFNNVRDPSHNELLLGELLGNKARWPYHTDNPAFEFLSNELSPEEGDEPGLLEGVDNETVSKAESTGSGNSVETTPEQPA